MDRIDKFASSMALTVASIRIPWAAITRRLSTPVLSNFAGGVGAFPAGPFGEPDRIVVLIPCPANKGKGPYAMPITLNPKRRAMSNAKFTGREFRGESEASLCDCLAVDPCGCHVNPCACFRMDARGCYLDCPCKPPSPRPGRNGDQSFRRPQPNRAAGMPAMGPVGDQQALGTGPDL